MKTELALPKIEVAPKPTKSQLIEALVAREKEIWMAKMKEIQDRIKPINDEIVDEVFLLMSKEDRQNFVIDHNTYRGDTYAHASIKLRSAKLKKLINNVESIIAECPRYFYEEEVKHKIKERMKAPQKQNPLLNNPDVKQALDSILNQINGKPKAIAVQEVEVVTEK
jgi:hypothetical protein